MQKLLAVCLLSLKKDSDADAGFVLSNITGSATIGTDTLTFTQFSGAGSVTAGNGLTKSGNTLSVNVDDTTIEINSDTFKIKRRKCITRR